VRREYRGGAKRARLTQVLGGSTADLVITCDDLTNWPTGAGGRPFFVVVGRNTPTEEKILCQSRTNNTITVRNTGLATGRGADDTPIIAHSVGEEVEHVFTATDANEANLHINTQNIHIASNQQAITICTSTTRPANPVTNQVILETDTRRVLSYINNQWQQVSSDADGGFNPLFLIGA
jgi:hypothetical protein